MRIVAMFMLVVGFSMPLETRGDTSDASNDSVADENFSLRLRVFPLLSSLVTSLATERLNYSLWVDGEVYVSRQIALGISIAANKNTVTSFSTANGTEVSELFMKSLEVGPIVTYYFTPINRESRSFYVRGELHALFVDTNSHTDSDGVEHINLGTKSFGTRARATFGFQIIQVNNITLDMGMGVAAYISKPYRTLTQAEGTNEANLSPKTKNILFGLSDVYPIVNISFGILF